MLGDKKYNFGKIERLMVMGGGLTYLEFIKLGLSKGFEVVAVTSERHAREIWQEKPLSFHLDNLDKLNVLIVEDIFDTEVREKINAYTLGISFGAAWIFKDRFIRLFESIRSSKGSLRQADS
jgi:hypothetical protein